MNRIVHLQLSSRYLRLHRHMSYFQKIVIQYPSIQHRCPFISRLIPNQSGSAVHRSALDEAARIQRLINGQSTYTVVSAVHDRHKQLTNVLVTYGQTIFSRPYCTGWTLTPDFPRTRMRDDWFDEHCFHTMVNAAGRVTVRSRRKICTKGRDAQSLVTSYNLISCIVIQTE